MTSGVAPSETEARPRLGQRELLLSLLSGLIGAIVAAALSASLTYYLPENNKSDTQQAVEESFMRSISADSMTSLLKATHSTEPGSPAAEYLEVYLRLWKAHAAAEGSSFDEPVIDGGKCSKRADGSGWNFRYPRIQTLPAGLFTLSDFRFTSEQLIRTFSVDGIPIQALLIPKQWGEGSGLTQPSGDKEPLVNAYLSGGLIDPDLKRASVAIWITPSGDSEARDIVFPYRNQVSELIVHSRVEERLSSHVAIPERLGYYDGLYAAANFEGVGDGFIHLCGVRVKRGEQIDNPPHITEAECSWLSLTTRA